MLAFSVANTNLKSDDEDVRWILDSGASAHMSFKQENFVELYEYTGSPLKLGNQETVIGDWPRKYINKKVYQWSVGDKYPEKCSLCTNTKEKPFL